MICSVNQWTGFYMIGTFVMTELIRECQEDLRSLINPILILHPLSFHAFYSFEILASNVSKNRVPKMAIAGKSLLCRA